MRQTKVVRSLGRNLGLLAVGCLIAMLPTRFAAAQDAPTADAMISALSGLETPYEVETPALRQQAAERIKSRADLNPLRRPLLAPQLNKLPHVNLDIQFNPDSPIIRPQSYRTVARLADVLTSPALSSSTFLIIGRIEANGKRDINLTLSHRRAESIRDALVMTYKVSAKRLHAVGLGEEQLVDADHPKAAVNLQSSVVTIR